MFHWMRPLGDLACNCSILGDEESKEALLIDPGDGVAEIRRVLDEGGWRVREILLTHAHIDHVLGLPALRKELNAPVRLHPLDKPLYEAMEAQFGWLGIAPIKMPPIDAWLKEGEDIPLGPWRLKTLFTPGHAPGHVSFYVAQEKLLISADVLFKGSIGRTDLPGGNHQQLIDTIRAKLLVLPDDTRVIPGHGEVTTIGEEKQTNPFLQG
jgi:glyoxylase-like metal-dependent hydrolase (beta-lactamase superfamily II)